MRKFLLSLTILLSLTTTVNLLSAQDLTRQQRKEKRAAYNAAEDSALSNAIKGKSIVFTASEIMYGQTPALTNIRLGQLYGVWVEPTYLKVYLPLYGPNNFNGQPSLMHRLDFFVNKYKYSVEAQDKGGYIITIVATDPWSINTYTFQIMSTPNGNWSSMSVQTPFVGPVTYNGTVMNN